MTKFKIIAIIAAILFLSTRTSFALFDNNKIKEMEDKIAAASASYEDALKDCERLKEENRDLSDKYAALAKENEAIKQDRENLMAQAKNLLTESGRAKESEEMNVRLESEKLALEEEGSRLKVQNASLADELKGLKAENERMAKEIALAKSGKLKKELADLKSNGSRIRSRLAKVERESKKLGEKTSKLERAKAGLEKELAKYKKDYAEAIKTNKAFEQDMQDMPKKFSELARQNKRLIKETSEMHYNLGVFYTKTREYDRARAEFEKALDINPDDASAHFNLGYVYAEYIVDRKKAVAHFKDYLRLSKTDEDGVDWARKYILTWQTFEGKEPMR